MWGVFYFKLFICPPDVKRPNFFRGFTTRNLTRALPWTQCRAYNTSRPPPAFYNNFVIIFHEIEHSKTQSLFKNFSKIAWINACHIFCQNHQRLLQIFILHDIRNLCFHDDIIIIIIIIIIKKRLLKPFEIAIFAV